MSRLKKTTRNYVWLLVANALLIGFVAVLWQVRLQDPAFAAAPEPVLQGAFAELGINRPVKSLPPAEYLARLEDTANLADLKGEWVILNLWASWCPPCLNELPSLQKLSDNYAGKGLKVLAVSIDEAENKDEIASHVRRHKLGSVARNWDHHGQVSEALWPEAMPTTYIIDPQGKWYATLVGEADWAGPDAAALVDSLLKASPSDQARR